VSPQPVLEPPPADRSPTRDPWWARLADTLSRLAWRLLWSWRQ